jgi:hypothetical protein
LNRRRNTPNYGRNVIIGNVNTESLNNTTKTQNNNWLGSAGDLEAGLKYIQSLKQNMKSTTQLMDVVFDTHGGYIRTSTHHAADDSYTETAELQFRPDPLKGDLVLTPGDITNFMKTGTAVNKNKDVVDAKNKSIGTLKQIFDPMGKDGNFVFSACRIGDGDEMGKALQQLSGGRINIYITPDLVRESDNSQKILELDAPRIRDDLKRYSQSHFVHGFILFPANFKDPVKTEKNITLNSNGFPVQQTEPKDKATTADGHN